MVAFEREITEKIKKKLDSHEILVLLGSRQVGKTTILKTITEKLERDKKNCLFIDLDIETNLELFSSYKNVIDFISLKGFDPQTDRLFLFLDEFQRVKNSGQTMKNIHDHHPNIKIIATGSSSIEINKAISESMSGRKIIFRVYPLSFREFLLFNREKAVLEFRDSWKVTDRKSKVFFEKIYEIFISYLVFGGYPEVTLEKNLENKGLKLNDILSSYLRKDIKENLNIKDTIIYKNVLELLSTYTSNLVNINSIARDLGIYHRNASSVIDTAQETYFISLLRPFFKSRRAEIVKNPKIYFEDTGMRNFLIKNMSLELRLRLDLGQLVENYVFNEIKRKLDVFSEIKYWRNKNQTEIDFLIFKNQAVLVLEVKSGSFSNIPKALSNFCQKENLKKAVVFNKDFSGVKSKNGTEFFFIPYVFAGRVLEIVGF